MNYKIISTKSQHLVFEKQTSQVVRMFKTRSEAREYLKFLNLGGGWGGWTPNFILEKK
jgi:diaminopimelate decarboxylase